MNDKQKSVRVNAADPVTFILEEPLRFEPPLVGLGNSNGFTFWWKQLQTIFTFNDPRKFPPLPTPVTSDEERALKRFITKARDLASSSTLNHGGGVTIDIADDGESETVTTDRPAPDLIAGFAVIFRQFYAEDAASFKAVSGILMKAAQTATDENAEERIEQLKLWGRANGQLKNKSVERLALEHLAAAKKIGPIPDHEADHYPDREVPQQAISAYFYGEHIHWGEKSVILNERAEDAVDEALYLMGFLKAATGLSHLYLGYSLLIEAALCGPELD